MTTALWLDADDASTITLNGSNVSQWADKSGNARDATQVSASLQPSYNATFNSKPIVTFTRNNTNHLVTPIITGNGIASGQSISVIQVIKPRTGWGSLYMSSIGTRPSSGSWWSFIRQQDTNEWGFHGGFQYWSSSILGSSASILVDTVAGGSSLNQFRDGTQIGTVNRAILPFTSATSSQMWIGAGSQVSTGEAYEGDIMEVVFFTNAISTDTRQRLEGYLAHKWGLTANLPNDHPYKSEAPTL
jgi:hypothetical protein